MLQMYAATTTNNHIIKARQWPLTAICSTSQNKLVFQHFNIYFFLQMLFFLTQVQFVTLSLQATLKMRRFEPVVMCCVHDDVRHSGKSPEA